MKETMMSRVIFQSVANQRGILFGGKLLAWMDEVAGVTAWRLAEGEVITTAIEHVQFYKPLPIGTVLDVVGEVVSVGNTSMKVQVRVLIDRNQNGEKDVLAAEALFVYVAIDGDGRPRKLNATVQME